MIIETQSLSLLGCVSFYFIKEVLSFVTKKHNVQKKEKIIHHYHPIYDIQSWKVIGHESLFRNSSLSDPEVVFKRAKKQKKLYELDSQSVHKAYLTYIGVSTPPRQKNCL